MGRVGDFPRGPWKPKRRFPEKIPQAEAPDKKQHNFVTPLNSVVWSSEFVCKALHCVVGISAQSHRLIFTLRTNAVLGGPGEDPAHNLGRYP
jgi:hypothetical protein